MNKLISIIIPVYNAEKTLSLCIESIIEQTDIRWEAILINDGSYDNSGNICNKYVQRDNRFKVIHQKNHGASVARNNGIEQAQGKWITFIDADDYIDKNYLTELRKGIIGNATLIIQGLKHIKNGNIIKEISFQPETVIEKDFNHLFNEKKIYEYGYSVAKLYNSQIIRNNNIRFKKEISYSEDLLFMLEYILHCDTVNYISGANYNYITDHSTLSQQFNSFEDEYKLFISLDKLINRFSEKFKIKRTDHIKHYSAIILFRSLISLYKKDGYDKEARLSQIDNIKKKHKNLIWNNYKPQIVLLRVLKIILFISTKLFDFVCMHKFK